MNHRYRVSAVAWVAVIAPVIAVALLLPMHAAGQAQSSSLKAKITTKQWTAPRTPDGQPNLEGFWTNATTTPLERPNFLAGKQVLTEAEAAEFQERVLKPSGEGPPGLQAGSSIDASWFERGKVVEGRRTSLIVDPPDGRIPPLTPAAQERVAARAQQSRLHPADGPENRSLAERCLMQPNAGPPMLSGGYNNNCQIIQGPGYVAILVEMLHEVRIIPLDGRPHLPPDVRNWLGDSRGRWEGSTLVVDTTNFTGKTAFRGSGESLHLTERFTRTAADTIRYEFTVADPESFKKPWSAEHPMRRGQGPIYEYACNEGNYALANILQGARAEEKRAAEETSKRESK
jgi:hypothetical protein